MFSIHRINWTKGKNDKFMGVVYYKHGFLQILFSWRGKAVKYFEMFKGAVIILCWFKGFSNKQSRQRVYSLVPFRNIYS